MSKGLLYSREYPINDRISVIIPTIEEILEDEAAYYNAVNAVIATPSDFMVQLDDAGIDFTSISSYELFLLLFPKIKEDGCRLIFGDLDLSKLEIAINDKNGTVAILDENDNVIIDRAIHAQVCQVLLKINNIEKHDKIPANAEAKKFMLERARIKQLRAMRKKSKESQLEDLIVAMVNTEQFKYGYEGVLDLTIYQFNASVYQIIKKVNYDNLMIGCYSGTVNMKELSQDSFNWLSSK